MEFPKVSKEIFNPINENVKKLAELFPSVVKDGQVDIEALKAELGQFESASDKLSERYELGWAGKEEAKKLANQDVVGRTLKYIPEDSKDPETTENLYIEGDNLEVLKLLRNSYYNKVKMIYIDPPYNTGKDFIYRDKYSVSEVENSLLEGELDYTGKRLVVNQKSGGRYHSNWLSMMYPRIKLAKDLLTDDGVIFISIDDNEADNLKKMCNEIYGEENFIARLIHKNNSNKNQAKLIGVTTEYVLCYAKSLENLKESEWRIAKKGAGDIHKTFLTLKEKGLSLDEIEDEIKQLYKRPKYAHLSRWNKVDENGVFKDADLSREGGPTDYTIINPNTGQPCIVPNRGWGKSHSELLRLQKEDLIWYGDPKTPPGLKDYLKDDDVSVPDNFWYFDNSVDTRYIKDLFGDIVFDNPKPIDMISQIIEMSTDDYSIIIDFFSGSSTTAHSVMKINAEKGSNRKFIMIQLPESCDKKSKAYKAGFKYISEIGKERIRRAGDKILEENKDKEGIENLDIGFKVFKVADTNIRWFSDAINSEQMTIDESTMADKDKLDFNLGTKDIDVVYEIMLRHRDIPLSTKVEKVSSIGERTYIFADTVLVCLEEDVTETIIDNIAVLEPMPSKIIFRDSAFDADITLKTNSMLRLEAQMKKNSGTKKKAYRVEFI
ncbi:site-specific DNA-methyltransferase [Heliorestis acidaminivorans]|uniref:Site-specific DNA-methyltransferase n=1 Tax=Heliorestis acidaminivorans TaxID=553427 RepID=A0A6I0F411_9FIRM|nr:site-specific DNA-methyltransferase [Heliorestis acidaminivorans]KAB2953467.1 site-specific DNA-methyltransferase [Heliorestis acidaminivorans]